MELSEYLDILSEQIRCKKARPMIVEEIKAHITDQAEAFIKEGMGEEQAMAKAVMEMGDPVEAGVALDRVHRPRMQWTLVLLVVLLSLIGMIMQIVIFRTGCLSNEENITTIRESFIYNSIGNTFISFAVMAVVCIIDYTFLAKYPIALWWGGCMLQFILTGLITFSSSYMRAYQTTYYLLTLMVPAYAAIIFHYKNKGMSGLLKCIGLYLGAIAITYISQTGFLSIILELTLSVLFMLTIAIMRGWFGKKKVSKLFIIWAPTVGIPALFVSSALFFNDTFQIFESYQIARIQALFQPNHEVSYTVMRAREEMEKVTLFGTKELPLTTLPALQNDYIITSMFTYFGALLTMLVLGLVACFILKALHLSVKQKNKLGSMVSISCVIVLLVKIVTYIIPNIGGYIIFSQKSMPFLSYGFSNAIINGVLVGLLLSIYRNTNIVSEKDVKPKYAFRLPIQKI